MMSECLTEVCGSVQLLLSGSNSCVSLFHPQKMSSAWREESDTDMNLFWITSVRSFISNTNYPWCFIHSEALRILDFTQQFVTISTKVDHSVRRSKLSTNMTILTLYWMRSEALTFLYEPNRTVYHAATAEILTDGWPSSRWTSHHADWLSSAEIRQIFWSLRLLLMRNNKVSTE